MMIPEQLRGETSHKEHEASNVSKHLVRSISQKLKNDYHGSVMDNELMILMMMTRESFH
jgi:hypothetical protein